MDESLKGSCVRDLLGRSGRVLEESAEGVRLSWDVPGQLPRREELVARDDVRLGGEVEVLTLARGWVPLGSALEDQRPRGRDALEARRALDEASKHYPFKFKSRLGPGPRGRRMRQRKKWKCTCSGYVCQCRGPKKQVKTIRIKPGYKAAYNSEYRAWRAAKKRGRKKD